MKKIILCSIILLIAAGCQTLKELTESIRPHVSVADVRVTDFSFQNLQLTYDVKVDNPNPVSLHMQAYDYNLAINGHSFIQGNQNKSINIAAAGASTFQLPVKVNFFDLYKLFNSLKGKDRSNYQLSVGLYFNLPGLGKTKIPLTKKGTLPLLKLPKIHLASIQLQHINLQKADLVLNLDVKNPNGFNLLLNGLNYKLFVNNHSWVEADKSTRIAINKNGNKSISIPVSLNLLQIGSSVIQLLQNSGKVHYQFKGDLNFGVDQALFKGTKTLLHIDDEGLVPLIH